MKIKVLDNGYVALARVNGTELDIVNAARLSYDSKSKKLNDADKKLIRFLVRENHTSPLRHVGLSIEFKAPLIVARQHWRHIVGASTLEEGTPFSELSRRYVRGDIEIYTPRQWRLAPDNSKQGSGGDADYATNRAATELYLESVDLALNTYDLLIQMNIAPEQARLALPAYAMYTKYLWTPSLQAAVDFVWLRAANDAQNEIRSYGEAVKEIIYQHFPTVAEAEFGSRDELRMQDAS